MLFSSLREFIPKSYLYLRNGYSLSIFKKDLFAGITVGIIALPLAMAFAIASGVKPEQGLYTAIIAGFLISALGGSRVQIGGPTGAFVVIIYGIIQRTGFEGLCMSTTLAGILLILLGVFRIGSWIKYVPNSLVTGFTTGIAFLIFSSQIKDFFGLQMGTPPAEFVEKWISYFHAFSTFDPMTLSMASGMLILIVLVRKYLPMLPWGITAIVFSTLGMIVFQLPLETIYSRYGEIPRSLPMPSLPCFSIPADKMTEIFTDAITIAFLGGIESLLSAVIGDGMIGGRHRSNCELVAQGIANLGSVVFGGIPATGAIARTAANVKNGAQTPVAGMIHAVALFLIMFWLAPVVSQIPLAALSAVLVMIAWNMSEIGHFIRLLKGPFEDRLILFTGFLLTVFVDITVAISAGMILACFLFMKKMSQMSKVVSLSQIFAENLGDVSEKINPGDLMKKKIPQGVEVYEIQGPFFFGAANMLKDVLVNIMATPKVFILRLSSIPMIDASGLCGLEEFFKECEKKKIVLFLAAVHGQARQDLKNFGLEEQIGKDHIFSNIDDALEEALKIVT